MPEMNETLRQIVFSSPRQTFLLSPLVIAQIDVKDRAALVEIEQSDRAHPIGSADKEWSA